MQNYLLQNVWKALFVPAQSPVLNIVETLRPVLESRVRSRFSSPSSLKQIEDVLYEKGYRKGVQKRGTEKGYRKGVQKRGTVHVTVHRDKFLIKKPITCTNISNLFLELNSTCF